MKIPIATSMMVRRPWISVSFPNSGVAAVAARRYAVTTHDKIIKIGETFADRWQSRRDDGLLER